MLNFFTKLFFESPFMKFVAVGLVFYFALYRHDESDDSIAKRFNKEIISKDFDDVKNKTGRIFNAISYKKSITELGDAKSEDASEKRRYFVIKDQILQIDGLDSRFIRKVDNSGKNADCLDVVDFSYLVIDGVTGDELYRKDARFLTISEQESIFFERLLVGMKKNEEKEITVNKDYNFLPAIIRKYLVKSKDNNIVLNLKLSDLTKGDTKKIDSLSDIEKIICKRD